MQDFNIIAQVTPHISPSNPLGFDGESCHFHSFLFVSRLRSARSAARASEIEWASEHNLAELQWRTVCILFENRCRLMATISIGKLRL